MWQLRIRRNISATEILPGRVRNPSPTTGSPVSSTCAGKRSPHNIWLWKTVGFCPLGKMEGCGKHQCPLKEPTHRLTHLQVLTLGTGEGTVTQGTTVSYKGQTEMCGISVTWLEDCRHFPCLLCRLQADAIFPVLNFPPQG